RQQAPGQPETAKAAPHVEVFQVDALDAVPGREVEKPQCHCGDFAVDLGDVCPQRRVITEKCCADLSLDDAALIGGALEAGQVVNHRGDRRGIGWCGTTDADGHG